MLRDDPTSATAVLKDVTDTVMRSKPWESFCTAVNDEVSKYLRKDNVEVRVWAMALPPPLPSCCTARLQRSLFCRRQGADVDARLASGSLVAASLCAAVLLRPQR